jgi:hypothetical protein
MREKKGEVSIDVAKEEEKNISLWAKLVPPSLTQRNAAANWEVIPTRLCPRWVMRLGHRKVSPGMSTALAGSLGLPNKVSEKKVRYFSKRKMKVTHLICDGLRKLGWVRFGDSRHLLGHLFNIAQPIVLVFYLKVFFVAVSLLVVRGAIEKIFARSTTTRVDGRG